MELFTTGNWIFKDKSVFDKAYIPQKIKHRDKEIKQIATSLSFILEGGGSFATDSVLYGLKGTGKTATSKYLLGELRKHTLNFRHYYVSFTNTKTEFKALEEILISVGLRNLRGKGFNEGIRLLFDHIKTMNENHIIFIFDEINKIQEYDSLLYSLLRPHEVYGDLGKHLTCIFITNDLNFPQNISPGTKSSFSGVNKVIFSPYNANQLRDILSERAKLGLSDTAYDETVLSLCAAFGAQEHGDARETIKLLAKSAEAAVRKGDNKIRESHVREAREELESEGITGLIKILPMQLKTVALAIARTEKKRLKLESMGKEVAATNTGEVYKEYKIICERTDLEKLTQRRITDILDELATIGLIDAAVVSYGRYGRTKELHFLTSIELIEKALTEDTRLETFRPAVVQSKLNY